MDTVSKINELNAEEVELHEEAEKLTISQREAEQDFQEESVARQNKLNSIFRRVNEIRSERKGINHTQV